MGYNVGEIYKSNSDYLKAEDIGANFWTATIKAVEMKDFENGDRKLVLNFAEMDKVLPLNMTNARTVADLYGGDTDAWVNRQIMLFTMPTDFQGKKVQAIRLRAPAPAGNSMPSRQPQQQREPAMADGDGRPFAPRDLDDEIPF